MNFVIEKFCHRYQKWQWHNDKLITWRVTQLHTMRCQRCKFSHGDHANFNNKNFCLPNSFFFCNSQPSRIRFRVTQKKFNKFNLVQGQIAKYWNCGIVFQLLVKETRSFVKVILIKHFAMQETEKFFKESSWWAMQTKGGFWRTIVRSDYSWGVSIMKNLLKSGA